MAKKRGGSGWTLDPTQQGGVESSGIDKGQEWQCKPVPNKAIKRTSYRRR